MASPLALVDVEIEIIDKLISISYVDMTLKLMERFGVSVQHTDSWDRHHQWEEKQRSSLLQLPKYPMKNGDSNNEIHGPLTSTQRVTTALSTYNEVAPDPYKREAKHFTEIPVLNTDVNNKSTISPLCAIINKVIHRSGFGLFSKVLRS
ncbi:hypothetical protein L1887_24057 [Cichorium endivia]|nr:hypothetical protein L1887_24057 [Cichorium endivia]